MIESLLNNTSNCFNFILSSEPWKKPVASVAKWNHDYLQEYKGCRQHVLVNYAK